MISQALRGPGPFEHFMNNGSSHHTHVESIQPDCCITEVMFLIRVVLVLGVSMTSGLKGIVKRSWAVSKSSVCL